MDKAPKEPGVARVRRDLATKQQQPIHQMGLSWGPKFWTEGSLAADILPPSRAVTALQRPAWKGLRRAVLPSPALHLISGPAGRPGLPGGGGALGRRGGGGEVEGRKGRRERDQRGLGGRGGPGASGGFESRLAPVPDSNLRALGSPPRRSGWESPPNPLPKAERALAVNVSSLPLSDGGNGGPL